VCLDPVLIGHAVNVQFTAAGPGGTCANTYPTETMWIDDVQSTTDAACPSN
jgi:hypothetical protein